MKKISLLLTLLMIVSVAMAQKSKVSAASSALSSGKLDIAKENIDEALQDPSLASSAKAYLTKAKVYTAIAQDQTGIFKSLSEDAPIVAYNAYMEALEHDTKGKLGKKVKTSVTNLLPYIGNMGANLYEAGDYKAAADTFEKVLEIQTSEFIGSTAIDTAMMFNVALASEKAEDYPRAEKYYSMVKDYGYQEAKTYARLAAVAKAAGTDAEATKYLEEGVSKYPNDLNIIFELINVNLLGGTPEKATEYVDKAIELDPKNSSLYRAKGSIYEKLNDPLKAKELYIKALEIDPADFASQYNIAAIELKEVEKKREAAANIMEQAAYDKAVKEVYEGYYNAIPAFEKALELSPGETSTLQVLKELYFKLRDEYPDMMEKYNDVKAQLEQ